MNPFDYEYDDKIEYKSIPTQRNAKYKEVPENVFQGNEIDSYTNVDRGEIPYPQLKTICGIDCEESKD